MGPLWNVRVYWSGVSSSLQKVTQSSVSWTQLPLWSSEHRVLREGSRCVLSITQPGSQFLGIVLKLCE